LTFYKILSKSTSMKQQIKTIITDAAVVSGAPDSAATHDKRVNEFLDTIGKHEVISIQCYPLAPVFTHDIEQGPALVTTIVFRK
jgi:hypothetical protein